MERKFILVIIILIALGAVIVVSGYMQPGNNAAVQNNTSVEQKTYDVSNSTGGLANITDTSKNASSSDVQSTSSKSIQNSKNTQNTQNNQNSKNTQSTSNPKKESNTISAAKAKQIALQNIVITDGVTAHDPALVTFNGRLIWRVPIFKNGKKVGIIDIDAYTGACLGGSC